MFKVFTVADSGISTEVERFIATHIKSLEQLEILLLLNSDPKRAWSLDDVYEVIKSSESSVRDRLDELASAGLIEIEHGPPREYRFAPKEEGATLVIDDLAAAYKERRVKIVQIIYAPPTSVAEEFANAFKFRRDK